MSTTRETSLVLIRRFVLAAVTACVVAALVVGPVAAVTFQDVMVSSFKAPGPGGAVALTKTGAGTLTLTYSLVGLSPNAKYRMSFSDKKCAIVSDLGSDIADVFLFASGRGTSFIDTTFDDEAVLDAKSVRLFRQGEQVDCALFGDFNGDGDVDGADYLTIVDKPGAKGIVDLQRTSDPTVDRLVISLVGLSPGDYTLRASTQACGSAHHHPADTLLGWSWGMSQSGGFMTRTTVTHDSDFETWASVRILKDDQQIACAKTYKSFAI
jgi:hypothetical protein